MDLLDLDDYEDKEEKKIPPEKEEEKKEENKSENEEEENEKEIESQNTKNEEIKLENKTESTEQNINDKNDTKELEKKEEKTEKTEKTEKKTEKIEKEKEPIIEKEKKPIKKTDQIEYAIEDRISISEYEKIENLAIKYPFELDDFQKRGIIRVENHENVLICAHTSSGKTLVAEYAIAKTKQLKKRIIYTSPIKALSNQKFRDFKLIFSDVGIITGDVSINQDAQCIIMTTEILQNWLYKGNDKLSSVNYIIFDEVHYINDQERGHVWEEILILLPSNIRLVMLSATIPNYFDFAKWIGRIKGMTIYIEITYKRVVPLEHKIYINNKNVFIFKTGDDKILEDNIYKALKGIKDEGNNFNMKKNKPQGKKERQQRLDKLFNQIKSYNSFLMKRQLDEFNNKNPNSSNSITRTHLKIEEIVNYINKQNLTPCVMFTFSIKKIDEYAKMLSQNTYINPNESQRIIKFFDKSIKSKLSESDQKIGQIQFLKKLLPSGIGVHHSGLLPILKEIVEILYSKGLIKILFATTSFSIGLNMPTKTVVFTDISKFNEGKSEILSSSEYLQMCGRAGRRGNDDKGHVFLMLGDKYTIPTKDNIVNMCKGSGTSVSSKFRLSYKTIICFLFRKIKDIVSFFKESYIENSTFISMPLIRKKIEDGEKKLNQCQKIDCMYDIESIGDYYECNFNLEKIRSKLFEFNYINDLLKNNGRLIKINSKVDLKDIFVFVVHYYTEFDGEIWCISVNNDKKKVIEYENKNIKDGKFNKFGVINGKFYEYFTVQIEEIVDIYDYILSNSKNYKYIKDEEDFDFYQQKDLENVLNELLEINDDKVKVCNYLKISRNDLQINELINGKNNNQTLLITNQCHNCPLREKHIKQYENIKKIKEELKKNKDKLSEENLKCFGEFNSRLKVLKKLNFVNEENQLEIKGKAAKEITSADCIIVSELLLSNIIDKLSIDELIAFLSCFIGNNNSIDFTDPEISENFTNAIKDFKLIYDNVVEIEKKENFEENTYNRRISFALSKPIQSWMLGKHFYEILDECDMDEGKIYSMINRLCTFFDSLCEFYKVLGNTTLGEKFVNAKNVLLREIMTCQSLYLDDDLDIDNI